MLRARKISVCLTWLCQVVIICNHSLGGGGGESREISKEQEEEDKGKDDSDEDDERFEEINHFQDDRKDKGDKENLSFESHEGKRFGCSKCGKYFVNLDYLSQHKNCLHMKIKDKFSVPRMNGSLEEFKPLKIDSLDVDYRENTMDMKEKALFEKANKKYDQIPDFQANKRKIKTEQTEEDPSTKISLHLKMDKRNKLFPCSKCGERFKHLKLLAKHKNETHFKSIKDEADGDKNQQEPNCRECDATFDNKQKLQHHIIKCHTKAYPLVCDICGKGFMRKMRFDKHVKNCVPKEILEKICRDCDKTFEKSTNFRRHMASHSKAKDFKCVDCEKAYADKRNLVTHVQLMHPQNAKQFEKEKNNKCDRCDEHFVKKTEVALHKIKSHGESYHVFCERCGKGFLKSDCTTRLRNHQNKCF